MESSSPRMSSFSAMKVFLGLAPVLAVLEITRYNAALEQTTLAASREELTVFPPDANAHANTIPEAAAATAAAATTTMTIKAIEVRPDATPVPRTPAAATAPPEAEAEAEPTATLEVEAPKAIAKQTTPDATAPPVPEAKQTTEAEAGAEAKPTTPNGTANTDQSSTSETQQQQQQQQQSLLEYYDTVDPAEFTKRTRDYLLRKQDEYGPAQAHWSTRAMAKDPSGNSITTYAFIPLRSKGFIAGFRNQMIALTMLALHANAGSHHELLIDSLKPKDTHGSEQRNPLYFYFDIEHWNKHSYDEAVHKKDLPGDWFSLPPGDNYRPLRTPNWLPRLVFADRNLHTEWNVRKARHRLEATPPNEMTRPYGYFRKMPMTLYEYRMYASWKGAWKMPREIQRNPVEIMMLKGALKPHLVMQNLVDRSKDYMREQALKVSGGAAVAGEAAITAAASMSMTTTTTPKTFRYMTLHARVEPDMQVHPVCRDAKVTRLREIVDFVEAKWPDEPPVDAIFLPINRQGLEKQGKLPEGYNNATDFSNNTNWIAVENLKLLNELTGHRYDGTATTNEAATVYGGMWKGRVPVFEFGSEALSGTVYSKRPSLSGSILNYFLALDADIFIGTEVSSYSNDILGARFFRERRSNDDWDLRTNNYKYRPEGLVQWVDAANPVLHSFDC
eukprot:CAMPEP_0201232660 /NCGR_PEP_ID=MMETSP0852-20130820/4504_1 /ASSEMBLY_ACC=CAM_ASM_000632 /TAXON_ID=183588 /ORGANISM="Pseudo-nitzschia fraudulenta, Strain WWA7" /LENGTH=672 /DNA_ID=CAMNT_0047525169 /DNA_START=36 /DNA_END=2054 /DNA_ORIENTATION=+